MSGHSKWSKVKHQKEDSDTARGQIFTKLANAITIAVREGGNRDQETNFRLRLVVEKARQANMPKANIERAIERASGKGEGGQLEEIVYEGFGPGGAAVLAEAITDNKQRTAAAVKHLFQLYEGNLSGAGSVVYLFDKVGQIEVARGGTTFEQIFDLSLSAGADDVETEGENYIIYTNPRFLHKVKAFLETRNMRIINSELNFRPKNRLLITDQKQVTKLTALLQALTALDDVHKIYTTAESKEITV